MYLRTTRRTNKDGSVVEYYQLAHNEWDPVKKRSRTRILYSFGRADDYDREALVRLTESIARRCGVEVVDPEAEGKTGKIIDSFETLQTLQLGVPWVADALWRELGLDRVIKRLVAKEGLKAPYERVLLAIVANRLMHPSSKLGVWERWLERVHLPGAPDTWKLDWFYEGMDLLYRHAEEVEKAVFFEVSNLLNLSVDLVFFDTTTASFAIDEGDPFDAGDDAPALRRFGHSKEGTWTPQVVIALAVTRDGLPVRSWVLPGNTTDSTVVKRIREDLRGWKLHRVLMVGDAGMDSAENRAELARACGRFVLAVRVGSLKEVKEQVLSRPGRYRHINENLRVKEVVVGEGEKRRRYILCLNPKQAERQKKHRKQVIADLREELAQHRDADAERKWVAQVRASGRYGRYVKLDDNGQLVINHEAIKAARRMDGKWVLHTNDDSLAPEDAADAYKSLLIIERCFRNLKRIQLRMRPMFHRLERRIVAHVKLCVLALLLQRIAEMRVGRSWMRIRHVLDQVQVNLEQTPEGLFWKVNKLSDEAAGLLDALQIKPPKRILDVQAR